MSAPLEIVSLCDESGVMVEPWARAGYRCLCLDIAHPIRAPRVDGNITFQWCDVRGLAPDDLEAPPLMIFAFPPCTDLAASGARDFRAKGLARLIEALAIVEACRRICASFRAPWMLENPVGRLSACWREPDYTFQPCDYGDDYTQRTCIWAGNNFIMPQPSEAPAVKGSRIVTMPDSQARRRARSLTPRGFAQAVYDANAPWTPAPRVSA